MGWRFLWSDDSEPADESNVFVAFCKFLNTWVEIHANS